MKKQTICLNMIVKNEREIIRDCLDSIKEQIDCWVIVDTGSTDGTQEEIIDCMKEIPGQLVERPWKNFAYNRNEALLLAHGRADYSLIMDADDLFQRSAEFEMPELIADCYLISVLEPSGIVSPRVGLINNRSGIYWVGSLHETVQSNEPCTLKHLENAFFFSDTKRGARGRDPEKYLKDAQILEKAIQEEPENTRYLFYLGQSYLNGKDYLRSLGAYQKRAEMGGCEEEVFFSLCIAAKIQHFLQMDPEIFLESFSKAYAYRPSRAEPLFYSGVHYIGQKNFKAAYPLLKKAASLPRTTDQLFIEFLVIDFFVFIEFYHCCVKLGRYEEAEAICRKLLKSPHLPEEKREAVQQELKMLRKTAPFLFLKGSAEQAVPSAHHFFPGKFIQNELPHFRAVLQRDGFRLLQSVQQKGEILRSL
ncbi:MAG: glycosyltransferase [Chlamydiota bacterium]